MGSSQSFQNIYTFDSYNTLVQRHPKSFFFGPQLQIYKNKFNPKQQFTKHTIKFDKPKQMQHFVSEIRTLIETKENHVPFNILYPMNVFQKEESSIINNIATTCSQKTSQVIIIHKWLGRNLNDLMKENSSLLNEKLIWFILNDISKSLQILEEKNHASYYLMPQNIWYNQNDNWFLYDGHYIIGSEYIDDFYQKKIQRKEFISDDFRKKVQENSIITSYESLQEDIYCLGYCLIFMMTGIHPKQLPSQQSQKDKCVNYLLQKITDISPQTLGTQTDRLKTLQNDMKLPKYSSELVKFVRNLIKPDPKRRYSIRHIRSYLKTKEQQIFMNQEQQWSRTTIQKGDNNSNENINTTYKHRKTNQVKSPQRQLLKKVFNQNPQGNQKNMTSMRTLKKQSVPQKVLVMNQGSFPRFPISLIENEGTQNSRLHQGQTTPIRKIEQIRTRNFNEYKNTSNTNFRADMFSPNPQSNVVNKNPNNFRKTKPPVQGKHIAYISPQKHRTSSINPHSTMQSFPPNIPSQQFTNTQIQSANHIAFKSPPHHAYQSPTKVKLNYFSPQKGYL